MSGQKILIVEDDGIVAMDIQSRIKKAGYIACAIASSGKQAIEKVKEHKPDLILMDIVLKGEMDGIEATNIIQDRFATPVIFLTAHADEKKIERAKIANPFGYIIKPFRDRELKITIKMALYKARIDKEKEEMRTRLHQAQRLESIGTLAGGIAHDFNNILTSIFGYSEIALSQVEKGSQLEEDIKEIYKAGTRAKDLIQQILTIARKSDEDIYSIKISLIAKETIKLIRASIPATINIKQEIKSNSKVLANPTSIHQVLMNLLTNAAQAMGKSGGVLTITIHDCDINEKSSVEFKDLAPGKYVLISISDTGTGISPENLNLIFEPYFTTKSKGEGTGLGLAVVDGAVKSMGGEIFVKSEIGKGTVFTIYLPATKINKDNSELKSYKELPGGNEHILFVDDEVSIAKVGKRALEKLGYKVTEQNSSIKALELFRKNPDMFQVVITDMTMPKMTGEKLSQEILKINSEIPIIICTGFSKNFSEKDAFKIGASAFCYKPLNIQKLAETIRKVLERK